MTRPYMTWTGDSIPPMPHVQWVEGEWHVIDKDGKDVYTTTDRDVALAFTRLMPV